MSVSLPIADAERFDKYCKDRKLKRSRAFSLLLQDTVRLADEFFSCETCGSVIRGSDSTCPICKIKNAEELPEILKSQRIELIKAKIAYKRDVAKRLYERVRTGKYPEDAERADATEAEIVILESELYKLESEVNNNGST